MNKIRINDILSKPIQEIDLNSCNIAEPVILIKDKEHPHGIRYYRGDCFQPTLDNIIEDCEKLKNQMTVLRLIE